VGIRAVYSKVGTLYFLQFDKASAAQTGKNVDDVRRDDRRKEITLCASLSEHKSQDLRILDVHPNPPTLPPLWIGRPAE
jgi:hypothetical protein